MLFTGILVFIIITLGYQRITGELPNIFGYSIMYVQSGSMEPEIMTGDAIIVKKCDALSLIKDDVICYKSKDGIMAGKYITHKVVKAPYEEDGKYLLVTRGVANYIDDDPINIDQVVGIYVGKSKLLTYLYQFFKTIYGLITILIIIAITIANEIIEMFKKEKEESEDEKSK